MAFSINIYDNLNPDSATVLEHAEAGSLVLTWLGSEQKREHILGSELSFSLEVTDFQDAHFGHLNTSDERRYLVTVHDEDNDSLIWQGYLLPDQYNEPYTSGAFFINLIATCGLGSLKGQYLPDAYYSKERTLIDVLAAVLRLTGLQGDILVTPAIVNKIAPEWHQLYVDTSQYQGDNDRDDAYTILEKIMVSTLCRIHQIDGDWQIYGLNQLNRFSVKFFRYDYLANHLGSSAGEKKVRTPLFLNIPVIGTHTPRKTVAATYPLAENQISESVYKISQPPYLLPDAETLVNHEWFYNSAVFTPKYSSDDGELYFAPLSNSLANYVQLRREILIGQGAKIKWVVKMTNWFDGPASVGRSVEEIVDDGDWEKLQPYDIFYTDPATGNEVLLYSNVNGPEADDLRYQMPFNDDREAQLKIAMIAPVTAYYNIRFYQPTAGTGIKAERVYLNSLELNVTDAKKGVAFTNEIAEYYTQNISQQLSNHDDLLNLPHAFRLSPLAANGTVFDSENVLNLVTGQDDGGHYIRLSISALLKCVAYPDGLFIGADPLPIIGPEYNYLGSQEMLLRYDQEVFGRVIANNEILTIRRYGFQGLPQNVADWQAYTDNVYNINYNRYGSIYVEILRNLYAKAHPTLTATVQGLLNPGELVAFDYDGPKGWYVLDCQQNLDAYETELILSQNFYGQAVTDNLPPQVDAGPDQVLPPDGDTVNFAAVASDPDGTIENVQWSLLEGNQNAVIQSPGNLNTSVSGLTGDSYLFEITVTDDVGLTASDQVRVTREIEYRLVMTPVIDYTTPPNTDDFEQVQRKWWDVSIEPDLLPGQVARLIIDGVLIRQTPKDIAGAKPSVILSISSEYAFFEAGTERMVSLMRNGDVKRFIMQAKAFNSAQYGVFPEYANKVYAKIQADITAEISSGPTGTFVNVPIQETVEARK